MVIFAKRMPINYAIDLSTVPPADCSAPGGEQTDGHCNQHTQGPPSRSRQRHPPQTGFGKRNRSLKFATEFCPPPLTNQPVFIDIAEDNKATLYYSANSMLRCLSFFEESQQNYQQ